MAGFAAAEFVLALVVHTGSECELLKTLILLLYCYMFVGTEGGRMIPLILECLVIAMLSCSSLAFEPCGRSSPLLLGGNKWYAPLPLRQIIERISTYVGENRKNKKNPEPYLYRTPLSLVHPHQGASVGFTPLFSSIKYHNP